MQTQRNTMTEPMRRDGRTELTHDALARISVKPPYFGLRDLEWAAEGVLAASVPVAPPPAPEVGAAEAAQIARHLAILGSCAAALAREDDKTHHYLAVSASYERAESSPDSPVDEPMRATARADWADKRTAVATMRLESAGGELMNSLEVTYAVLAPSMFARLNPIVNVVAPNTSVHSPLIVDHGAGRITADCGPIPLDLCAGHFPSHPAAPVALVMGRLVLAARHAVCSRLGEQLAYRVEGGMVEASRLAQAGQQLVLETEYVEPTDSGHRVSGTALADGEPVGSVSVRLAAFPAAAPGCTGWASDDLWG